MYNLFFHIQSVKKFLHLLITQLLERTNVNLFFTNALWNLLAEDNILNKG